MPKDAADDTINRLIELLSGGVSCAILQWSANSKKGTLSLHRVLLVSLHQVLLMSTWSMLRRERLNAETALRLNSIMIGVLFLRMIMYIKALLNSGHILTLGFVPQKGRTKSS